MDLVKDKLSNFFTGGPTQYYRFEGKANFHVEVIESPDRKLPLNTSSVRLKIFSTKEKNFELPVKIKWFRLVADRNYEIEDLDNLDFYNFSAMDIGGEIKASIRSNDENFKGTISVIFGPIRFDDMLRPPLEQVLISGFSKFNVLVPTEDDGPDQMQTISVFLSPNQMKFLYYNEAEPEEFYLEILNERPRLEIVYSQSQDLALYFDEVGVEPPTRELRKRIYTDCDSAYGEKYKIILRFFSRNTRDIFVTAVRLFRIVPVVSLSNLFRQIDILVRENRMFESNSKLCLNEVLVEYDRVRTHLMSTIEYAKDLDKDREELQECVTVLERDLEHTMTEFRKYIEESMRGVAIHNRSGNNASHMNTSAYKKIEDLNASLLSNQGDMRSVIRKKIDQANPVLVAQAVQGAGAPHASLSADLQKANDEIERLKKVNAMYLAEMKKYSTDLKKYEAKRQAQKSNIKQMKEHLNNVSKEFGNLQEITEQVRGNTSSMNSKLFDVSGIESRKDEDDMFTSNPMFLEPAAFKKTKELTSSSPVPQNTETNGGRRFEFGAGLPKIDESNETSTTGRTEKERLTLELRAKEEEIVFLRKKIRDTENLFSENQKKLTQMMIEKSQIQQQVQVSQMGQSGKYEVLQKELAALRLKELDWKKDAEESTKFVEDMRAMLKKLVSDDESVWKAPINNSVLDESLVNDVFKVNLNTKLKMLDLENDGLKRKFMTLSKEVALLREETRQLKSQDPKLYNQDSVLASALSQQPPAPQVVYQLPPGGLYKEEADILKKKLETISQENESLKQLITKIRSQDTEVLGESSVSGHMKQEISDLKRLNENLLQQKLEFSKKFEATNIQTLELRSKVVKLEEDLQKQAERSQTDAIIIQQLRATNERVVNELSKLQERVHVYEEGKNSFISDMNDSFYSQGQNSAVQGKFK